MGLTYRTKDGRISQAVTVLLSSDLRRFAKQNKISLSGILRQELEKRVIMKIVEEDTEVGQLPINHTPATPSSTESLKQVDK